MLLLDSDWPLVCRYGRNCDDDDNNDNDDDDDDDNDDDDDDDNDDDDDDDIVIVTNSHDAILITSFNKWSAQLETNCKRPRLWLWSCGGLSLEGDIFISGCGGPL